jgi:hypothetical protein
MNFLWALPFIFLVMLASVELDCYMMRIKPPTQLFLEWIERKFK